MLPKREDTVSASVTLTNRDLGRMYGALKVLGNRRMATLNADLKVARLLRTLEPLAEPIGPLKQRAITELLEGAPKELTGAAASLLNLRAEALQAAIDAEPVDVVLPLQFALTEADLPREMPGPEGWRNLASLGAIVVDLGPLYVWPAP